MANPEKSRDAALDIVRIAALFCVISVHFFMHNGFYQQPVAGKRMYIMTLMRTGFMVCVPLFIILSGYLMSRARFNKSYYKGIIKTLCIYLFAGILCMLFKCFYEQEHISPFQALTRILDFSAAPYGWYIEMYIGLFLLIPFLNILYQGIASRNQKRILLLTFLFLTALPGVVNIYNFSAENWWLTPSSSLTYQKLIPSWWSAVYPITYYFIGCYLREYRPKLKRSVNILLLLGAVVLFGSFNFYRSHGVIFLWEPWQGWGALPNAVMAVLLFLLLYNLPADHAPEKLRRCMAVISNACLGGYLVSYIFDKLLNTQLNAAVPDMPQRLNYYFLIVPLCFLGSLLLSMGINLLYKLLQWILRSLLHSVRRQ